MARSRGFKAEAGRGSELLFFSSPNPPQSPIDIQNYSPFGTGTDRIGPGQTKLSSLCPNGVLFGVLVFDAVKLSAEGFNIYMVPPK